MSLSDRQVQSSVFVSTASDPETRNSDTHKCLPPLPAEQLASALSETAKIDERIKLLRNLIGGRIVFSTSLGIEDQVILHAIVKTGIDIDVVTLDTGRHFPETYETLARTERVFGKRIKVVMPEAGDVETLVSRDGIQGFRDSVANRKACCEVRKVRPLNRVLAGAAAWITGMRRDQSVARDSTPLAEFDSGHSLVKVNPLSDWTLDRVQDYAVQHEVPLNPLHTQRFPSIGCQPCTRAIAPGEHSRAGRWWWENEDHKECGLHMPLSFGGRL